MFGDACRRADVTVCALDTHGEAQDVQQVRGVGSTGRSTVGSAGSTMLTAEEAVTLRSFAGVVLHHHRRHQQQPRHRRAFSSLSLLSLWWLLLIPLMAPHLVHTQGLAGELGCKKRKGKFQSLAESLRRYLDQTVFKAVFFL